MVWSSSALTLSYAWILGTQLISWVRCGSCGSSFLVSRVKVCSIPGVGCMELRTSRTIRTQTRAPFSEWSRDTAPGRWSVQENSVTSFSKAKTLTVRIPACSPNQTASLYENWKELAMQTSILKSGVFTYLFIISEKSTSLWLNICPSFYAVPGF